MFADMLSVMRKHSRFLAVNDNDNSTSRNSSLTPIISHKFALTPQQQVEARKQVVWSVSAGIGHICPNIPDDWRHDSLVIRFSI